MFYIKLLIAIVITSAIIIAWSLCAISSKCSRIEEERENTGQEYSSARLGNAQACRDTRKLPLKFVGGQRNV